MTGSARHFAPSRLCGENSFPTIQRTLRIGDNGMNSKIRVVHYLNQFFAQIGSEDKDNVGAGMYRKNLYIINSGATIARMVPTLQRMAALGVKLARREAVGKPESEGYLARGIKRNEFAAKPPAERAVDMLLAKLRGDEF